MQNLKFKFLKIYIPFLIIAFGCILFYYGFRWLFDIKLGLLPLKEDVLNIWIPIAFIWIPVFFWLRKPIQIVNLRGKNGDGHFLTLLLMCIVIVIPTVISQKYLEKNAYSINEIATSVEFDKLPNEKYFKVDQFEVVNTLNHTYVSTRTSGKHNEHLNVSMYIACPFDKSSLAWYGVQYDLQLRNKDTEANKRQAIRRFLVNSNKDFKSYDFQDVTYFEKLSHSDNRDGFIRAIKEKIPIINGDEEIILIPKKKPFEARFGSSISAGFIIFGIGLLIILLLVMIPKIDKKELANFKKNKPPKDDDFINTLKYLNPFGAHKATAILLISNILVFIIMVLKGISVVSPTAVELLEFGGNRQPEIAIHGELWRLLTSTFIHAGFIHLALNLFGIALYNSFLEKILSPVKLLLVYVTCGCIASIASVMFHENTVSVGASGAIFGLSGIILAFIVFKIYPKHSRGMIWTLLIAYGGLNLVIGFLSAGIDNAAHVGGLLTGFIIGTFLSIFCKEDLVQKASKKY